jgi:hypothetical protein
VAKRIGNKIIRNNLKIKCLERKVKEQQNVSTLTSMAAVGLQHTSTKKISKRNDMSKLQMIS